MPLNWMNALPTDKDFQVTTIESKPGADRRRELIALLQALKENQFTGYVKLNYVSGQIRSIETFEEILK